MFRSFLYSLSHQNWYKKGRALQLDAFIRPEGITVPMADPAVLADPTTVPADPSRAPVAGIRQVQIKSQ